VTAQVVDAELGLEFLPLTSRSAVDSASSRLALAQPSLRSSDLGRVCIYCGLLIFSWMTTIVVLFLFCSSVSTSPWCVAKYRGCRVLSLRVPDCFKTSI
jgi:hypothetical protein